MTKLFERPHSLIENFELLRPVLNAHGPATLQPIREKAFLEFEAVGLPSTRDEEFKYVSLRALHEGKFAPSYGATVDRRQLEKTSLGNIDAITLTFVNGEYAPELSSAHALPDGVFVGTLEDGFLAHENTILEHLGKHANLKGRLGSTNDERFVSLNTAFLGEGAFVYVPKGIALEKPVHVVFLNKADHGPFVTYPRVLIVLEAAAQAKVIETYEGLEGIYFTNAVTEIVLGKDSIFEHIKVQMETPESVHIANLSTTQSAGSIYTSNNVCFGSRIARNDVNVALEGEYTETWLNGVTVGVGEQVVDNHTRIDHAKPNCVSFEVYKSILSDRSTGIFNGKIFVYEDAQKTDAKQTNQGLLLSPNATFNTKPQLEIFADDVKCTHGATIGQLRDDALFYLRARGIPKAQAQAVLVYAFAAEVLEKIGVPDVRVALEAMLFAKLSETEDLPEAIQA
jgi:Fe-S cluster assembly protein SufD